MLEDAGGMERLYLLCEMIFVQQWQITMMCGMQGGHGTDAAGGRLHCGGGLQLTAVLTDRGGSGEAAWVWEVGAGVDA